MKPHIFVDSQLPETVMQYLEEHATVDAWGGEGTIPRGELFARLTAADGYLTFGRRIDGALLDAAPGLKVVSTISVGYNHFDIPAMKSRGVIGTHTPGVLDETVADLVFLLMLGTARRGAELDRYVREGLWKRGDDGNLYGCDVHHATVGIIGMGRIGEAVARRAALGFGMNVQYFNRSRKPEAEERYGARYKPIDELLATSDFVVLLTPLTDSTRGLIGKRELSLMKCTAILINAARGQVVDEEALVEALKSGVIAGAGLDVYEQEPLPAGHPFAAMPNVMMLPHIGSATTATRSEMAMLAARNLVAALSGNTPPQLVPEFAR